MKNLILLIMLFSLHGSKKTDYISIEYAGNGDKGVDVIYLSRDSIPGPERITYFEYSGPPFDYLVNDKDLGFVKKEINLSRKKPFEDSDYRGFKVTIRENSSSVSFFIVDKDAGPFFDDLTDHFKSRRKYKDLIVLIRVHKAHIGR